MSWVHDTGYGPAFDHEGGVADVLENGTDPSTPPDQLGPRVTGWRARPASAAGAGPSSTCGRTGPTPSTPRSRTGRAQCKAEWDRHLHTALPVLAIHDLTQQIAQAQHDLADAVCAARATGLSWTVIADAAGTTPRSARERWSGPSE